MLVSYHQSYSSTASYQYSTRPQVEPNTAQKADTVTLSPKVQEASEPQPLLSGARNILNFIARGLESLKRDGATPELIAEKFEQAKAGFLKGYAQASDELEEAGLLDQGVQDTISLLKQQVLEGLDKLSQGISPTEEPKPEPVSVVAPKPKVLSYSMERFEGKDFVFQLKTREGDTVFIDATERLSERYNSRSNEAQFQYTGGISLSVRGDINEDEAAAIDDLLNQVLNLADDFYNGDIGKAYEAALELGYDKKEIASFAVRLTMTESQYTEVTYQKSRPKPDNLVATAMRSLSDYAAQLLEQVQNQQSERTNWMQSLAEQLDEMNGNKQFSNFLNSVL